AAASQSIRSCPSLCFVSQPAPAGSPPPFDASARRRTSDWLKYSSSPPCLSAARDACNLSAPAGAARGIQQLRGLEVPRKHPCGMRLHAAGLLPPVGSRGSLRGEHTASTTMLK